MITDKKESRKAPTKKKKSSWEHVQVFVHKDTKVAARVARLNIKPHAKYTYETGYVDDEGDFHRFHEPKITIGEDGRVEIEYIEDEAFAYVRTEALGYIAAEVQKREHELRLQKRSRAPKGRAETKPSA